MYQIESMGDDDEGDDELYLMKLRDTHQQNESRHGACEDDRELTAPWVDGDPSVEADDAFFSRPLNHRTLRARDAEIDAQIVSALMVGVPDRVSCGIVVGKAR